MVFKFEYFLLNNGLSGSDLNGLRTVLSGGRSHFSFVWKTWIFTILYYKVEQRRHIFGWEP